MFKFLADHDFAGRLMGVTGYFIQTVGFDVHYRALRFFQNSHCAACFTFLSVFLTAVKIFILPSHFGPYWLYCKQSNDFTYRSCCVLSGVGLVLSFLWYVTIHTLSLSLTSNVDTGNIQCKCLTIKWKKPLLIVLLHRIFDRTLLRNLIGPRTRC